MNCLRSVTATVSNDRRFYVRQSLDTFRHHVMNDSTVYHRRIRRQLKCGRRARTERGVEITERREMIPEFGSRRQGQEYLTPPAISSNLRELQRRTK